MAKWIALRADTRTHHQRCVCRIANLSRLTLGPVPLEPFANGLHCARTHTSTGATPAGLANAFRRAGYMCIDNGWHCARHAQSARSVQGSSALELVRRSRLPFFFQEDDMAIHPKAAVSYAMAMNGCRPSRSQSPGIWGGVVVQETVSVCLTRPRPKYRLL